MPASFGVRAWGKQMLWLIERVLSGGMIAIPIALIIVGIVLRRAGYVARGMGYNRGGCASGLAAGWRSCHSLAVGARD